MNEKPANILQFRSRERDTQHVYMNGGTVSCGEHPTAFKRHKWAAWVDCGCSMDRFCEHCGLTESKWKVRP